MPAVFGGAIVTEQIFRVPGIGSLLITAILANDTPVVMAVTFVLRLPRRPLQPHRRYPLWLARPPHLLPLRRRRRSSLAAQRRRACLAWPRGVAALPPPPARGGERRRSCALMVLAVAARAVALAACRSTRSTSRAKLQGAVAGRIRSAPTISARTCWRACSMAGASRSRSGSPPCWSRSSSACMVGAVAGMSRGSVDAGADVAHRPVPVAAAAAAAAAGDLPVPRRR